MPNIFYLYLYISSYIISVANNFLKTNKLRYNAIFLLEFINENHILNSYLSYEEKKPIVNNNVG